jgi:hypothetical protein
MYRVKNLDSSIRRIFLPVVRLFRRRLAGLECFFKRSHKVTVALTVKEILDGQIAKKLA